MNTPETNTEIVNRLAAVDAKFAESTKDLIEGLARTAAASAEAKDSFDNLIDLLVKLKEQADNSSKMIGDVLSNVPTPPAV